MAVTLPCWRVKQSRRGSGLLDAQLVERQHRPMRLCKLLSNQIQSEADRGTVSVDARKNFSCMWCSMQDYTVSSCDPHEATWTPQSYYATRGADTEACSQVHRAAWELIGVPGDRCPACLMASERCAVSCLFGRRCLSPTGIPLDLCESPRAAALDRHATFSGSEEGTRLCMQRAAPVPGGQVRNDSVVWTGLQARSGQARSLK